MSLKETVNGQVDRAKLFVDRLRARYIDAYARALELSNERLDDLTRLSGTLGPTFRDAVETRIEGLRRHIDDLNRALAEKAIPLDRKARVGRMALNEKARKAGQGLRLVKGAAVDEAVEAIKSAAHAAEQLMPSEPSTTAEKPANPKSAASGKTAAPRKTVAPNKTGDKANAPKAASKKTLSASADTPAAASKARQPAKGRGSAKAASGGAKGTASAPRKSSTPRKASSPRKKSGKASGAATPSQSTS